MKLKKRNAESLVIHSTSVGHILVEDLSNSKLKWWFPNGTSLYQILEVVTK